MQNETIKKRKAYIAGKVTGLPAHTASMRFGTKQKELMNKGYDTVVPLDIVPTEASWEEAMRICIAALMECDELHLMSCWQESKGAVIERDLAQRLGMPIIYHKN